MKRARSLPSPVNRLIGRERELQAVQSLLGVSRLVTLTGAGGGGKTRLALEVGRSVAADFAAGACFVGLDSLSDASLVPYRAADALGLQEQGGKPMLARLLDYLRERQLLLILDNCEHVIQAAAELADAVLRAAPQVQILATSREALKVESERVYLVPSLPVPADSPTAPISSLLDCASVRLFVERANAVNSEFALTDSAARSIAQICRRLDGIPLAIELAAARTAALSPEQIAARLEDSIALLAGGPRTARPRQQTLRAALDWSYELLSEPERALFRGLSVFAGGWTLEAAEEVCRDGGRAGEVLDLLARLVEKSLVLVAGAGPEPRFRLLEPVRQYAAERLIESGERDRTRERHLDWFLRFAAQAEPHESGPGLGTWMKRLEAERDNLHAAIEWSLSEERATPSRGAAALRLVSALALMWGLQSHASEGGAWLDSVLNHPAASTPELRALRASVLARVAWMGLWQFHPDYIEALSEQSLALTREIGDRHGMGMALRNLSWIANDRGEYARALELADESAALLREAGDSYALASLYLLQWNTASKEGSAEKAAAASERAFALVPLDGDQSHLAARHLVLGRNATLAGEYERAVSVLEEGLLVNRESGSKGNVAFILATLGEAWLVLGNAARAAVVLQEALELFEELGITSSTWTLDLLGLAAARLGDYPKAIRCLKQSLRYHQAIEYRQGMLENLAGLGAVAVGRGQLEGAARLFGSVERLLEMLRSNLGPADLAEYRRSVAACHARLDAPRLARLWAEGQALTLEQSVALALALADAPEPRAVPGVPGRRTDAAGNALDPLTAREREVARLVAEGGSNRAIAGELVLSERTVENHVRSILSKLGFVSRTQIARWVSEGGVSSLPRDGEH